MPPPASSPPARPLKIFAIAGENSGDVHGGNLFRALFKKDPTIRAFGLGGPEMTDAGVKLKADIVEDLAIIGFVGVVTNFPEIRRLFYKTVHFLEKFRPDALVLIDYPGFNIRIAEKARRLGIPVVWYISPQIWAWHKSRLYTLARVVDRMIVIFPFEVNLYKEENVDVVHVGHPLFDVIKVELTREQVCREFGLDPSRRIIALIPGSRRKEVKQFLPIMLEGAKRYRETDPLAQFVIVQASTIGGGQVEEAVARAGLDFAPLVVDRLRYSVRNACDFSWVKSGTSTLEAAILGTPMLIVYRVNTPTWLIGKQLFSIGHIGLPNIIAGDRIVPELLQDEFTPRNLAERTHRYLSDPAEYDRMVADLRQVREKLGGQGASARAAEAVLEIAIRTREREGGGPGGAIPDSAEQQFDLRKGKRPPR